MNDMKPAWLVRAALIVAITHLLIGFRWHQRSAAEYAAARRLSEDDRKRVLWGTMYDRLLALRERIPVESTLWWAFAAEPWFVAYYLQPRLLYIAGGAPASLDEMRRSHPQDWVLYEPGRFLTPSLDALPPLKSKEN